MKSRCVCSERLRGQHARAACDTGVGKGGEIAVGILSV
jgi:hypothetical protein